MAACTGLCWLLCIHQAKKNKSIPPEVLLAAAKLAIYYSKARKNGGGDVHTAFVKNLRKAKRGPIGRVYSLISRKIYILLSRKLR